MCVKEEFNMNKILDLLRAVQEGRAHSQRDLARLTGFSLALVNSLIKSVQNDGYVVYINDKIPYQLTDKGRIYLDSLLREKAYVKTNLQIPEKTKLHTAVILAAGHNPNFDVPICLLKLKDEVTILDRLLEVLEEQAFDNLIIVAGYKHEMIKDHLKNRNITFLVNERFEWTGTMASLALAEPYVDGDLLVVEGDHVFEKRMLQKAILHDERSCVVVKTPDSSGHDAYVELDPDGFINRISKDIHQFNHLHAILAGFHKVSGELFQLMMDRYRDNENPYLNYEYVIENLSHTYKIPSLYVDDAMSYDINDQKEYEKLLGVHFPLLMRRESRHNYESIKIIFCKIMNIRSQDIKEIEYAGGMTNANFKIKLENHSYILRVPGECTDKMIYRENEEYNSNLGYLLGLNVENVYFDDVQGIKVTRYIENAETLSPATARLEKNIVETTKLLKKLHHADVALKSQFDAFEELEKYEKLISKEVTEIYDGYGNLREEYFKCRDRLVELGLQSVPCHNDLVAENFIKNEQRMYLIDWEYAGMNDPMWDIASHLLECKFSKEESDLFLYHYFDGKEYSINQIKKITIFMFLQDVLWAVWAYVKEINGESFGSYGFERLDSAKQKIKKYIELYESDK